MYRYLQLEIVGKRTPEVVWGKPIQTIKKMRSPRWTARMEKISSLFSNRAFL